MCGYWWRGNKQMNMRTQILTRKQSKAYKHDNYSVILTLDNQHIAIFTNDDEMRYIRAIKNFICQIPKQHLLNEVDGNFLPLVLFRLENFCPALMDMKMNKKNEFVLSDIHAVLLNHTQKHDNDLQVLKYGPKDYNDNTNLSFVFTSEFLLSTKFVPRIRCGGHS